MRRTLLLVVCLCAALGLWAQDTVDSHKWNLIPQPRVIEVRSSKPVTPSKVRRVLDTTAGLPKEGYTLLIEKKAITLTAATEQGLVWAQRTLDQLRGEDGSYPQVWIEDYPEFPLRAFMYDSGRNFVEVEEIKHYIDLISAYKVNVFHWHLTDKPAWRIECRVYPQLNDPKYQRIGRQEGRFYTYDQIREVIHYAAERGVMILPEIDMPGHSDFFTATFGFTMDSEQGRAVLEACLAEFFEEIPASSCPIIHIGSDEVHIPDPQGFMMWAEQLVQAHGRTAMAWNPGLPCGEATIAQFWRDGHVDQVLQTPNRKFVDSSMGYLNYYDPFYLSNRIFHYAPCGSGKASEFALGGILCLWNDVRVIDPTRILPHSGMLSGLLPFAERFWNGGMESSMTLAQFQQKMASHRDGPLRNESMRWVATAFLPWELTFTRSGEALHENAIAAQGHQIDLDVVCQEQSIVLKDTTTCVATTRLWAPCDTTIRAWIGFDAAARSNRISDGIPLQGKWQNGGEVTVNGVRVMPHPWNQPGMYQFHYNTWARPEEELPYTDEQFYWMCDPVAIDLQKGWNQVRVKVDRTFNGQRFQFAFIPVSVDAVGHISEPTGLRW